MKENSIKLPRVKCVRGEKGLLNEGEYYTVLDVTKNGNFILYEVEVPFGYSSFNKDRFVETDSFLEMILEDGALNLEY